jgi:hypothetical protein
MPYRDKHDGTIDGVKNHYVYGYSFALDNTRTVQSITLPNDANVEMLALNLVPLNPVPADLSTSFNGTGIVTDGSTFSGGLDGNGFALSGNLLGSSVTWNGVTYAIGPAGGNNVVQASGQAVSLPAGSFRALSFLATAVNGSQATQTFTVTYTDGTTQTFTQSISDWLAPQGYPGESTAITMAYRDRGDGSQDNQKTYVYGYSLALDSSKTVQSITLPNDANVDLLAIALVP